MQGEKVPHSLSVERENADMTPKHKQSNCVLLAKELLQSKLE